MLMALCANHYALLNRKVPAQRLSLCSPGSASNLNVGLGTVAHCL